MFNNHLIKSENMMSKSYTYKTLYPNSRKDNCLFSSDGGRVMSEMEKDICFCIKTYHKFSSDWIYSELDIIKANYIKNSYKNSHSHPNTILGLNRIFDEYSLYNIK